MGSDLEVNTGTLGVGLGDTWGHLGTLGVGLGDTWGHLGTLADTWKHFWWV